MIRILLVDDESAVTSALKRVLRSRDLDIKTAGNGVEALEVMSNFPVDIMISDLSMPQMDGNQLCAEVAKLYPETIRIILTAHTDLERVLEAINNGKVWGYLQKPWDNNELQILVQQAIQAQEILAERSLLRRMVERYQQFQRPSFQGFIGDSVAMQFVYNAIERSAPSNASVFITGPSGAGKEIAANAIHRLSKRKNNPFVPINCAAIPSELMESEIFGHIKGAFSGAVSNRDGAAQLADGGTLFLDEIGEMDMSLQAKLLRFIQTGTYQKVGSDKTESVNIRFICATNREPQESINEGLLREDLYYRLNVISIDMPALNERDGDTLLIAKHFLNHFNEVEEKQFAGFSQDAEAIIKNYSWPGNVRQLQNTIHSCVIMSDGPLLTADILGTQLKLAQGDINQLSVAKVTPVAVSPSTEAPTEHASAPAPVSSQSDITIEPLSVVERRTIENAIAFYQDNVVQAASALGVSPSTLYRKMQNWQDG